MDVSSRHRRYLDRAAAEAGGREGRRRWRAAMREGGHTGVVTGGKNRATNQAVVNEAQTRKQRPCTCDRTRARERRLASDQGESGRMGAGLRNAPGAQGRPVA